MSGPDPQVLRALMGAIAQGRQKRRRKPFVLGLCGAQGSGKSTLARAVETSCENQSLRCAVLSIDDLYLTRGEREELARTVHPLLATRGPPGTHDVTLGQEVIAALEAGRPCALPRFDKASDDRFPETQWPYAPEGCDVLIFEGWCVGARPQAPEDLADPVNALEAIEDPDGIWRSYVNAALGGAYQDLFARIDFLVLLAAPGFEVVEQWRLQQEEDLARAGGPSSHVMNAADIARFIQHYERLTRYILTEMPSRADLVVRLDTSRQPLTVIAGPTTGPES